VGIERALDMCVTGKPLKAPEALDAGLIDVVVHEDLAAAAIAFARDASRRPLVRTRDLDAKLGAPEQNAPLFAAARTLAARTRRAQFAPLKAIDAIEAAATLPFDEGCRRERELFLECVATEQAKALIHLFFADRAVARVSDLPAQTSSPSFETVAVVGAGTMGAGIATACANAGLSVILKDSSQGALDAGLTTVRRNYDSGVKRGRMTPETAAKRLAHIHPQLTYDGFAEADVIIEAVFEQLDLKKRIFRELDEVAGPAAVLATNTSTLDVDAIAGATSRPSRVVGLHFFSPAHVMRLLEVVRGNDSSGETLAAALAFGKRLGKVPVVVRNCRGFVGNRMMFPYMYEAQLLVEEGATPAQVDGALVEFGMAMGIFAVDDMAGIDVAWRVRQELGYGGEPGARHPLVADKLYALGRYGQKTGAGWYRYDEQRRAMPDPSVVDLIRATAADAGIPQRTFTNAEIVERCIYALVNEGARIVEDGSAQRASDIDVIYANGYGFPAWRGGPMFFADRTGLAVIHERIVAFEREFGSRWAPAPLLAGLAAAGRTFRERDRANG
jgi:3-hydroxyacyl-CoA dehydrogenase